MGQYVHNQWAVHVCVCPLNSGALRELWERPPLVTVWHRRRICWGLGFTTTTPANKLIASAGVRVSLPTTGLHVRGGPRCEAPVPETWRWGWGWLYSSPGFHYKIGIPVATIAVTGNSCSHRPPTSSARILPLPLFLSCYPRLPKLFEGNGSSGNAPLAKG